MSLQEEVSDCHVQYLPLLGKGSAVRVDYSQDR